MKLQRQRALIVIVLLTWIGGAALDVHGSPNSQLLEPNKVKLEVSVSKVALRVAIVNTSDEIISVNKRFLYGSEANWTELAFIIRDKKGKARNYMVKATTEPPTKEDLCTLWPRQFVGTEVLLSDIGANYALADGTYNVTVEYMVRSDDGELVSKLTSQAIAVSFSR